MKFHYRTSSSRSCRLPRSRQLPKGILDAIDLDSYRVEKQAMQRIMLPDDDAEIDPVRASAAVTAPSPSWTGSRTSCRRSTSTSATSRGRTPTAYGSSSSRPSRTG